MPIENVGSDVNPDGNLNELVELRIAGLPPSVRTYIRNLKSEEKKEDSKIKKFKDRQDVAEDLLIATSEQILLEEDRDKRDLLSIKTLWLLEATGLIDNKQKRLEVSAIYDNPDVNSDYLESTWPDIEVKLRLIMPQG